MEKTKKKGVKSILEDSVALFFWLGSTNLPYLDLFEVSSKQRCEGPDFSGCPAQGHHYFVLLSQTPSAPPACVQRIKGFPCPSCLTPTDYLPINLLPSSPLTAYYPCQRYPTRRPNSPPLYQTNGFLLEVILARFSLGELYVARMEPANMKIFSANIHYWS